LDVGELRELWESVSQSLERIQARSSGGGHLLRDRLRALSGETRHVNDHVTESLHLVARRTGREADCGQGELHFGRRLDSGRYHRRSKQRDAASGKTCHLAKPLIRGGKRELIALRRGASGVYPTGCDVSVDASHSRLIADRREHAIGVGRRRYHNPDPPHIPICHVELRVPLWHRFCCLVVGKAV
jgi:hypothetical protein